MTELINSFNGIGEVLMEEAAVIMYVLVALFGLLVGSFLNVCIYRIPEGQSIVVVPSHCMTCGKKLHWYELIPLFSWLFLRGKCHGCKSKISFQYPLVEAANSLLWLLVFFVKGFTIDSFICMGLISTLFVIAVIDARTMEIPNGLVIFILVLAVIRRIFYHEELLDLVLGPVVMGGLFLAILLFSGGRAMGGGDVKLMFACGLYLGLKCCALSLVIACIFGSIIHVALMIILKKGRELAFGPYLALGYAAAALWGNVIVSWYSGFFM